MNTTYTYIYCAIAVLLLTTSCAIRQQPDQHVNQVPAGQVDKSPSDTNEYRRIMLANSMEVLLISSDSDQAAAVLDIRVGSANNPKDYPGLAHFLEHMLFLGTEKYPEPQSYQQFISTNGGSYNATTGPLHTNYFFTIDTNKLEPALDRLAQFFIAPLFGRKYTERELSIIESEYQRYQNMESRAMFSVNRETYNPKHPASHFSVGNKETLLAHGKEALYRQLLHFYQDNYSANRMKLVILGKKSLDALEAMAKKYFSPIINRNKPAITYDQPIYAPETLPMLVQIRPKSESYKVSYAFPIPAFPDYRYSKSARLVADLLGHESKGSLLDYLRSRNWATNLSAGDYDIANQRFIGVHIELTETGRKHLDQIHKAVFAYIKLIKQHGIESWRYQELQNMALINFNNQEDSQPLHLTQTLARTMHYVPTNRIFTALLLYAGFQADEVRQVVDSLRPDNVRITLVAPDVTTNRTARWYDIDYSVSRFKSSDVSNPEEIADLHLPEHNHFIPQKNNIHVTAHAPYQIPFKGVTTWYVPHQSMQRASIHFGIFTKEHRTNAKVRALHTIYLRALKQRLASTVYMARLAGLDYQLYDHLSGITLRTTGYADKLPFFFNTIVGEISKWQLHKSAFAQHRKDILRELRNSRNNAPSQRVGTKLAAYLIEQVSSMKDRLRIYQQLSYADWETFASTIHKQGKELILLGYGEITEDQMKETAQLVHSLFPGPTIHLDQPKIRIIDDTPITITEQDTPGQTTEVLDLYIQIPERNIRGQVLARLLANYLHSPFFHELRTQRELGYQASVFPYILLEQPGLGFIVESDKVDAQRLVHYFQEFIVLQTKQIQQLDQTTFVSLQEGLVNNLKIKPRDIAGQSDRYWQELNRDNTSFDTSEQMISITRKLTLEDFKQAYHDYVATNHRRIWAMTQSDTSAEH